MADIYNVPLGSAGTMKLKLTYEDPYGESQKTKLKQYTAWAFKYMLQTNVGQALTQTLKKKGGFNIGILGLRKEGQEKEAGLPEGVPEVGENRQQEDQAAGTAGRHR